MADIIEVIPELSVNETGEFIGAHDVLNWLNEQVVLEVGDSAEAYKIAKKHRAEINRLKTLAGKARKEWLKLQEQRLDVSVPELHMIAELAEELVLGYDAETASYRQAHKREYLEKAQAYLEEFFVTRNWMVGEFLAEDIEGVTITNEEFWTQTGNLNAKGKKVLQDAVRLHELDLSKQTILDHVEAKKEQRLGDAIYEILTSIDKDGIYAGSDIVKILMPLKAFIPAGYKPE